MKVTKKESLRYLSVLVICQDTLLSAKDLRYSLEGLYDSDSSLPQGIKMWVTAFNYSLEKHEEEDYKEEVLALKKLREYVIKKSKRWAPVSKEALLEMRKVPNE